MPATREGRPVTNYEVLFEHFKVILIFSHAIPVAMISNFLICFCNFDLSCFIFEKDNFIENLYILLSY